ncbi:TonB family protein [Telmatospirillum sp.]|uniref:energy transducer TonB n=1 Tax=Telmatospirillum sp. TaxID=2079197 RepID=UPI00284243C9|nr:TonB family protein [Telmatospirillum sp.]MDR3436094.1 TonB family protein [Telmatospirillum sp.]
MPVSLLAHAAVAALFWFGQGPSAPPPLPQIDLLPPAEIAATAEETPPAVEEQLSKLPAATAAERPQPAPPLVTTSEKALSVVRKPPRKPPLPRPLVSEPTPVVQESVTPATETAVTSEHGTNEANNTNAVAPTAAHPSSPPADYIGVIRGRLEKVKRYPMSARAGGLEGTVLLSFVLDRQGQVVSWKIDRRSGVEALDDEVGEMIQRASFPAFPSSYDRNTLQLLVPIEFSLKTP